MAALTPQEMRDRADAIDAATAVILAELAARNFAGASSARALEVTRFEASRGQHADSWRQAAEIVSRIQLLEETQPGGTGGPHP